jgi:small basic protein (TIGR04137 family)
LYFKPPVDEILPLKPACTKFYPFSDCHRTLWFLTSASFKFSPHPTMSKHNSLKSNATVGGKRSVLKRFERVKLLKERGEWKAGKSPVGLPKTKHEG